MASLDPESENSESSQKRHSHKSKKTYKSRAEITGADPKIRRRAEENQKKAFEHRERIHRFRSFATSPIGASIVLSGLFAMGVGLFLLVQAWVEIESGEPKLRSTKHTQQESPSQPLKPELPKEIASVRDLTDTEKAEIAFRSGAYQDALDQINLLEPEKQSSQQELIKAVSYAKLSNETAALEAFRQAVEKRGQNDLAWFQWGQYLRQTDRYEEALPKLRKALDLDPENELYRAFWGVTRVQAGTYFNLLWDAEKAIYIDPAPGDWLIITAAICLEVGDLPQALTMMKYAETRMEYRNFKVVLADPYFQKFQYDPDLRLYYAQVFL